MKHLLTFAILQSYKLRQFVDSRKELTAQSYRFFVEHAYNQFFQHEAFHQSARARTKVREWGTGNFHTSTKLDGYIWIAGNEKVKNIPERKRRLLTWKITMMMMLMNNSSFCQDYKFL